MSPDGHFLRADMPSVMHCRGGFSNVSHLSSKSSFGGFMSRRRGASIVLMFSGSPGTFGMNDVLEDNVPARYIFFDGRHDRQSIVPAMEDCQFWSFLSLAGKHSRTGQTTFKLDQQSKRRHDVGSGTRLVVLDSS